MKVTLISFSDLNGGAYIAAYRLLQALNTSGIKTQMLVSRKSSKCERVLLPETLLERTWNKIIGVIIRKLKKLIYYFPHDIINIGFLKLLSHNHIKKLAVTSDVINLHWIGNEMVDLDQIVRLEKPVIITMHDMWWIEGIFHYESTCDMMTKKRNGYLIKRLNIRVKEKKRKLFAELNPDIVCPSTWLAQKVRRECLVPEENIHIVPNPFNFSSWIIHRKGKFFEPNTSILKILFISADISDNRKGSYLLPQIISRLRENFDGLINLTIVGSNATLFKSTIAEDKDIKIEIIDYISKSADLVSIYNEHDVLLHLALLDNLPNTCVEAVAVGLPICGINKGGVSDIIFGGYAGVLVDEVDPSQIATSIVTTALLGNSIEKRLKIRELAMEKFSSEKVSRQYKDIFIKKVSNE